MMHWLNWYVVTLVIFVTAFAAFILAGHLLGVDRERIPLERLADPAPLPGELVPFPADADRVLLWSDSMAAADAVGPEVDVMIAEAERQARGQR
jgi:hypothetical protein